MRSSDWSSDVCSSDLAKRAANQSHFGNGGHVVMRDSTGQKLPQEIGRWIGLDRVHRRARKLLGKEAGGTACGVRANERDRLSRTKGSSYPQRAIVRVQLKEIGRAHV